ncbi:MAG: iron-containing alcohol dehydrogenase, partial [Candidatus Omnitrophica bacterium]|nr:iron-containing alcohol dehydrogenase [Candidatus Omnitrophota bacterium]
RHSRPGAIAKLARVAELLGHPESARAETKADAAIAAIESFIAALGLAQRPVDYGVPPSDFPDIAREVASVFRARIEADPVPTDAAGLVRILEQTLPD